MNKKAVITGAYGAIGGGITRGMAEAGYDLILIGRQESSLQKLAHETDKTYKNIKVLYEVIDLSREKEIKHFSDKLEDKIDVLINNACTCPRTRTETPEGIEMQFAANVLGYFWMTEYLAPKINTGGRVVNVASYWAGDLDISDIEFKKRRYDNGIAYRQSKQCNRMLTVFFAEKYNADLLTVNACHPGDVNSKLSNSLGFGGFETPSQGAKTPVWLATSKDVENITGKYFEHLKEIKCRFSYNKDEINRLYEICKKYSLYKEK